MYSTTSDSLLYIQELAKEIWRKQAIERVVEAFASYKTDYRDYSSNDLVQSLLGSPIKDLPH
jgi:hypothetical protein